MMGQTTMEIEHKISNDEFVVLDVTFYGDITWENDGIGAYEYWGHKAYDFGQDYPVCENMEWDKSLYNETENELIQIFMDINFDKIFDRLYEQEKNKY